MSGAVLFVLNREVPGASRQSPRQGARGQPDIHSEPDPSRAVWAWGQGAWADYLRYIREHLGCFYPLAIVSNPGCANTMFESMPLVM